jgi:hypothetical protein
VEKIDTVNAYSSKQVFQPRQAMYVYRTTVARSRNRSCIGKPTVRSVCISERRVTVTVTVNIQKQDRQCRCNVKLKRFRVSVVAVEEQCVLHILNVCL